MIHVLFFIVLELSVLCIGYCISQLLTLSRIRKLNRASADKLSEYSALRDALTAAEDEGKRFTASIDLAKHTGLIDGLLIAQRMMLDHF